MSGDSQGTYVPDGVAAARCEGAEAYLRQLTGKSPELTMEWLESVTEALRSKLRDAGVGRA